PWVETPAVTGTFETPAIDPIDGLKAIIGSPNYARKHWVWEQYDSQVMADTVRGSGLGAGVVRVHGTDKMLAFTSDVTPRYVKANPVEGGKQAVAEAYRNLCAVGATPLATTDNLNFGNPEKPEIMGQFVGAIKGIGQACSALNVPIVSGNVSLYNETDGQAILPTPTIGAVGLIERSEHLISGLPAEGDLAVLIGGQGTHLGQSALLAEAANMEVGDAPEVDLQLERQNGEFVLASRDNISAATDLSDGGLALAAFELAEAAEMGVTLNIDNLEGLFGEDQARYLVACSPDSLSALETSAMAKGVLLSVVGTFGGDTVQFGAHSASLASLSELFRTSFAEKVA
ncbi:MAG: AIR synthase related protein, partial [Boseongicola sp.]|nr:AIR synthase related protein [Boseongicola sp.]